jgi:hypothetical protein
MVTSITGSQVQNYITKLDRLDEVNLPNETVPNGKVLDSYYMSTDWSATGDDTAYLNLAFGNY